MELFWLVLGLVWVSVNYEVCVDLIVLKRILFGNVCCCILHIFLEHLECVLFEQVNFVRTFLTD